MANDALLTISINHPEGDRAYLVGWIDLTFRSASTAITIHVSDVNDPVFDPALGFLSVMNGLQSQVIEIDEEGERKLIRILPIDDQRVRFQVADYDYAVDDDYIEFDDEEDDPDYPSTYIDIEIDRDLLLKKFFSSFIGFLETGFQPDRWREDDIRHFLLPSLKERYEKYLSTGK
ncbi:MAG: hypothetical protein JKY89_05550 [Immundisolibacteraceae bacterium]|nr:hypothetical protein [Immundisolibacteraceae bacterium]